MGDMGTMNTMGMAVMGTVMAVMEGMAMDSIMDKETTKYKSLNRFL